MAKRMTIKVSDLKDKINNILARTDVDQAAKAALSTLLSSTLLETGNYNGFGYKYWLDKGYKEWREAGKPDFPEKKKYLGPEYDRVYY
jgi:hypothetical protein